MGSGAFCSSVLLIVSLALVAPNEASPTRNADLHTWSRLKHKAADSTESGKWRGDLFRLPKSTETEHYYCLSHTDTHCTSWNVSKRSGGKYAKGTCTCKDTASPFCQHWTCSTRLDHECSTNDKSKQCLEQETLNCDCVAPARNGRYCWKWHCREDSTSAGGSNKNEVYECLAGNPTAEYCYKWYSSSTSSELQDKSSECECSERGHSSCEHWTCRERRSTRCDLSPGGRCNFLIAFGVGGGMGCWLFLISLMGLRGFLSSKNQELEAKHVLLCFVLFCLPWSSVVFIWGGIFGFHWVLVLWSVVLLEAIFVTRLVERNREEESDELVRFRLPKIQVLMSANTTTKNYDGTQCGKANDV